jgi:hypothetical protein
MKKTLNRVPGKPSYTILDPIVDLLLAHGNALANEYKWGSNPMGYFCELKHPIDYGLVESSFELPAGLQLIKELGQIDYGLGTVVIYGAAI